jgi:hypothetical protein
MADFVIKTGCPEPTADQTFSCTAPAAPQIQAVFNRFEDLNVNAG